MRVIQASALLLVTAAPAFATNFISGTVDAGTRSTLDTVVVVDSDGNTTAIPATISAHAISNIIVPGEVLSEADVTATWASADVGTVNIVWGWNVATGVNSNTSAETNLAPTNWSYTFTATGNGAFAGNYAITGIGATFGLQPIYGADDLPFGPYGGTIYDPTGAGSFSVPLVNGQTYTIALYNFGNIGSSTYFNAVGGAIANIDWTISYDAVPEPASWALMIAGFGLVGFATRRRVAAIAA